MALLTKSQDSHFISKQVRTIITIQSEILETALLPGGTQTPAYNKVMQDTLEFLNQCHENDIARIKMNDLLAQVTPFVHITLKISNEELFFDVFRIQNLRDEHLTKILNILNSSLEKFEKNVQSHLRRIDKKRSPSFLKRLLNMLNTPRESSSHERSIFNNESHTYFDLLLMEHLLNNPEHLCYERAVHWLDEHFHGDRVALQQKISDQRDEQQAKKSHKNYLLSGGTSRDNHFLTHYEYSLRLDNPLACKSFSMFRAQWRLSNHRDTYESVLKKSRLTDMNKVVLFKTVLELYERALFFIRQVTSPESGPCLNLEADYFLTFYSADDYEDHHQWKESETAEYLKFSHQLLEVLHELYKQEEVASKIPHLDQTFFAEVTQETFKSYGLGAQRAVRQRLSTLTLQEYQNQHRLTELIQIHRETQHRIDTLTKRHLQYYLWNNSNQKEAQFIKKDTRNHYKKLSSWHDVLTVTSRQLIQDYLNLQRLSNEHLDDLRYCMSVYRATGYSCLHALELHVFSAKQFEKRYAEALQKDDPYERQRRLLLLLEEMRTLPTTQQQSSIFDKRSARLKASEQEFLGWFIHRNEERLDALRENILKQLRTNVCLEFPPPGEERTIFEAFQMVDYFSVDLQEAIKLTRELVQSPFPDKQLKNVLKCIENLERQVLRASEFCSSKEQGHSILMELQDRLQLTPPQLLRIEKILKGNDHQLHFLIQDIGELYSYLNDKYGIDSSYLRVLTAQDLSNIKSRYSFVELISQTHIKMFAETYQTRRNAMQSFLEKSLKQSPDVPQTAWKKVTRETLKIFESDNAVPAIVKLLFLCNDSEHCRIEFKLLNLFLNFTLPSQCREKSTYHSTFTMFESLIDTQKGALRPLLRKIRATMNVQLTAFKPDCLSSIYKNNKRALETDLRSIIGSKLDNLSL